MKERPSNFIEYLIGCFRVFLFGNDIEVMIPSHRYTIVLVIRSKLFYRVNPNGIFPRPDIVLQRELCCLKLHAVCVIKLYCHFSVSSNSGKAHQPNQESHQQHSNRSRQQNYNFLFSSHFYASHSLS